MNRLTILFALLLLALPWRAQAVPLTMSYQGRLYSVGGTPVPDSNGNTVSFTIYNAPSSGTVEWTDTFHNVATKNGLFSVLLGSGVPLNLTSDQAYYLEIAWTNSSSVVETLSPRQPLSPAPYAFWAANVDLPLSNNANTAGAVINVSSSAAPAVVGTGTEGLLGTGSVAGVHGVASGTLATGVMADSGAGAGSALKVSGSAQFWGPNTNFKGSVDFSAASVMGLSSSVPSPLTVTGTAAWPGAAINGINSGSGMGVYGMATQAGTQDANGHPVSIVAGVYGVATASDAAGVYGYSGWTGSTNAAGLVGRGPTGVYGVALVAGGQGGSFQSDSGTAVQASGLTGVAGSASVANGVGVMASDGGQAGAQALLVNGGALFNGSVTFTGTVSGIPGASVPMTLTNTGGGSTIGAFNTYSGGGLALDAESNFGNAAYIYGPNGYGLRAVGGYGGVYSQGNGYGLYASGANTAGLYATGTNGGAMGVQAVGDAAGISATAGASTGMGGYFQGNTGAYATGAAAGLSATTSNSAGYGVVASNPGSSAVAGGGAALYVSGAVKTSVLAYPTELPVTTYTLSGGAAPGGHVTFNGSGAVTSITVNNPAVTAQSVIIWSTFGAAAPPGISWYPILVANGSFTIKFTASWSVATSQGFNYLIIN